MKQSGKRYEASRTAQWVAAARSVGDLFPADLNLAHDPYGVSFAQGGARKLAELCLRHPRVSRRLLPHVGPLTAFLLWMQLRTRALDDVLLEFAAAGGRQVVLLGAGYDCRALRFGDQLAGATVYEVDHPATQAGKVARLPAESMRTRVVYVGWDFERDPMSELSSKLHEHGLDRHAPVLTLWEGVTMYLGPEAIESTVRAVHELGAPGSLLALTYIDARSLQRPDRDLKLSARIAARAGEPWRFGWNPEDLGLWFAARGFALVSNVSDAELAARFLPARAWRHFSKKSRRLAVVAVRGPRATP
ncbi:MAG: putative S-adenosyl-L-methionine-dependent methyltransferase [Myxococcaceae bacterium]|nr:putative S-adenosyl-L-methionine-dependent methyltransferase [Myxococcaceae bacterium]